MLKNLQICETSEKLRSNEKDHKHSMDIASVK